MRQRKDGRGHCVGKVALLRRLLRLSWLRTDATSTKRRVTHVMSYSISKVVRLRPGEWVPLISAFSVTPPPFKMECSVMRCSVSPNALGHLGGETRPAPPGCEQLANSQLEAHVFMCFNLIKSWVK